MMSQKSRTIGKFLEVAKNDPHFHLKQLLKVDNNFKIPGITNDALKLKLFPYSLRDRAKNCIK